MSLTPSKNIVKNKRKVICFFILAVFSVLVSLFSSFLGAYFIGIPFLSVLFALCSYSAFDLLFAQNCGRDFSLALIPAAAVCFGVSLTASEDIFFASILIASAIPSGAACGFVFSKSNQWKSRLMVTFFAAFAALLAAYSLYTYNLLGVLNLDNYLTPIFDFYASFRTILEDVFMQMFSYTAAETSQLVNDIIASLKSSTLGFFIIAAQVFAFLLVAVVSCLSVALGIEDRSDRESLMAFKISRLGGITAAVSYVLSMFLSGDLGAMIACFYLAMLLPVSLNGFCFIMDFLKKLKAPKIISVFVSIGLLFMLLIPFFSSYYILSVLGIFDAIFDYRSIERNRQL